MGLAVLTKQTALAAPTAGLIGLFLFQPRVIWRFGIVFLPLALGPQALLNLATNGGYWYHVVTIHQLPWSFENYLRFITAFARNYQILGLLALSFICLTLFQLYSQRPWAFGPLKEPSATKVKLSIATFFCLYLGAALVASFSAGTYGGNHNHLLELSAVMCLCAGLVCGEIYQSWRYERPDIQLLTALLAMLLAFQAVGMTVAEGRLNPITVPVVSQIPGLGFGLDAIKTWFYQENWLANNYRVPPAGLQTGLVQVGAFMKNNSGATLYADDVSLALFSGKPLFTTDPFTQTHATSFGRWDQSKLLNLIRQKQFSLIVLKQKLAEPLTGNLYVSPEVARSVYDNYHLVESNVEFIYAPT